MDVVNKVQKTTVQDIWTTLEDKDAWAANLKTKPTPGNPVLGRWHTRLQMEEADTIIRNDRLIQFALAANLHRYIVYPAEIEQHPFECWKPSCMGKTPKSVVAPAKWIADVLEAICGAYLVGQGEVGARHFLKWIGVSVLSDPHTFARPFYPDCYPNAL